MKRIVKQMIVLYDLKKTGICFMGYRLDANANYHHLIKRENGGPTSIPNGAVINDSAHDYLHIIEFYDPEMFVYLNRILQKENEQGCLSLQYLRTINYILESFEREHCSTVSSKNKILIKEEYLKRVHL